MTEPVGAYRCEWCGFRAVVPVLIRDHQTTCPYRPKGEQ